MLGSGRCLAFVIRRYVVIQVICRKSTSASGVLASSGAGGHSRKRGLPSSSRAALLFPHSFRPLFLPIPSHVLKSLAARVALHIRSSKLPPSPRYPSPSAPHPFLHTNTRHDVLTAMPFPCCILQPVSCLNQPVPPQASPSSTFLRTILSLHPTCTLSNRPKLCTLNPPHDQASSHPCCPSQILDPFLFCGHPEHSQHPSASQLFLMPLTPITPHNPSTQRKGAREVAGGSPRT